MHTGVKARWVLLIIAIMAMVVLGACQIIERPSLPIDAGLEITAAVETVYANVTETAIYAALSATATETAIPTNTAVPPTETPLPVTDTPTLTFTPFFTDTASVTPTATVAPRSNCLKAQVTTQTLPAGTTVKQGQFLIKRWTVLNIGECTWTTDFAIVYYDGTRFQPLPYVKNFHQQVAPDDFFIITFEFKAPDEIGVQKSWWMLRDATGQLFGIGISDTPLYIELDVKKAN